MALAIVGSMVLVHLSLWLLLLYLYLCVVSYYVELREEDGDRELTRGQSMEMEMGGTKK